MAQYRNINVRSPFYVQLATTEDSTNLELKIWSGDITTDKPVNATYILDKEQSGGQSTFEIAELIRDFCSQTSDKNSGSVWVETTLNDSVNAATSSIYLASEGYSLYNEGVKHNGNSFETDFVALPDEIGTIYHYRAIAEEGEPVFVPIYVQPQDSTFWRYRTGTIRYGNSAYTSLAMSTDSADMFRYIEVGQDVEVLELDFNGTTKFVVIDRTVCTKYTTGILSSNQDKSVQLQYVNKYGCRSFFPFTLKHTEKVSVSSSTFQRNTMDVGSLSNGSGLHASRRRITGSKQSFTINTDWLNEYYVKSLEELLMSEYVWAVMPFTGTSNPQPVNLKTQSMVKKNHLNDKLIQYTFNIETASEYINTVR